MADDGTEPLWSTVLPPEPGSVPAARAFARRALHGLGVPHTEDEVTLLVSELATNVVLHAGTPVRLSLARHDGVLRVEVADDSPAPPRLQEPDPLRPGGRGILLVEHMAQRWGVDADGRGKTIWFELAS